MAVLARYTGTKRREVIAATYANKTDLGALTLSLLTATHGVLWSATITGKTSGSTVTATSSDGTTLTVVGTAISGTFAAAGSKTVTLTETLGSATNSPNPTARTVTVS